MLAIEFGDPKARKEIIDRFAALPLLTPDRQDHIGARNCAIVVAARMQIGTIDDLFLLTGAYVCF